MNFRMMLPIVSVELKSPKSHTTSEWREVRVSESK
jgi:hypothetical protein